MKIKEFLKNKKNHLIILCLIIIGGSFVLWLLNNYVLDRPSFCISCHLIKSANDSWQKSRHKPEYTKNSCNACHVKPGLLGSMEASFYGLKNTYIFFFGVGEDDIKASKPVYCTQQGCHEQMEKSLLGKKVRVNHGLHMNMGYSCVICHDRVAHQEYAMVKDLSMMKDFCFACHNDEVAPRKECRICHVYQNQMLKGIETPVALSKIVSPHDQEEEACQKCHLSFDESPEKSCLNCHDENTTTQYQQVKANFQQRLNQVKAQVEETKNLFSQIEGSGPTWEQLTTLFQTVQKNYTYLIQDNSQGAHNEKLAETIINSLENDIQRIRYYLYNYKRS